MRSTIQDLDRYSENPVSGYPLTDGDLVALAETWWDVVIDNDLFQTLAGTFGGEWREMKFASARLGRVAETLGTDAVQEVRDRVERHWRGRVGEAHWNAYKGGEAILQVEAEARSEKRAERAGRGEAAGHTASGADGWSNSETQAVHRWVTTDPDVTKNWRELVAELLHAAESFPTRGTIREALARALREEAAHEWRSLPAGLLGELLAAALVRVDWLELAAALLSESAGDANPKTHNAENET